MLSPPTLYQPGTSWLHRLHPLTKLSFSLAAMMVIFGGPGGWHSALLPGLLALLVLGQAGLGRQVGRLAFRLLAPLAFVLFLVHGFFNPYNQTLVLRLGPLMLGQEGLAYASLIILRLASAVAASLVLVLSTHPAHLTQALVEIGTPAGLAYVLGSPLLLLPQIAGRVQSIQAAQQARGLEIGGNLLQRGRALFPLAAPLIFSALFDVEERSLALEVRGFSAPTAKTHLCELDDSDFQRVARYGLILLAFALLIAGIWERRYGPY